ncbi:unnamed protein product [Clonostachys rhizophaga]|uniref:Extracellular membrane protein CFEM domain-containing protein n=1 Tax=Clonostachys rhizophaga TaxID=160324 RepID=A0A9N9YLQ8_9HYPO|nr:unnamed protein product [Clonostachys rhizophaga]
MRVTHRQTALPWALSILVRQATAAYWINQLDNYSSLPLCAEGPISTIVRGMVKGCGDGGRATSYSCFCTKSSSAFKDLIASSVGKECSGTGSEVASATALFEEYCSLGIKQTSATTTGSDATTSTGDSNLSKTNSVATSTSATQAESNSSALTTAPASVTTNSSTINSVASTTAYSVSDSTSPTTETSDADASSSSGASLATGAKVAIGICIPLAVIAIAAAIFIFFRRRRETKSNDPYGGVRLESREEVQVYPKSTPELDGTSYSPYESPLHSTSTSRFHPPQEPRIVYEKAELDGTSTAVGPSRNKYELE